MIKLEDGAVWTQVDATELFVDPKVGDTVRIKKASLGSYLMVIGKTERSARTAKSSPALAVLRIDRVAQGRRR